VDRAGAAVKRAPAHADQDGAMVALVLNTVLASAFGAAIWWITRGFGKGRGRLPR
jgi:hypothetical protein